MRWLKMFALCVTNASYAKRVNERPGGCEEKRNPSARAFPAIKSFEILIESTKGCGLGVAERENSAYRTLYQSARERPHEPRDFGLAMQTRAMQALVQR